jgi:hypothetical protein
VFINSNGVAFDIELFLDSAAAVPARKLMVGEGSDSSGKRTSLFGKS